MSEQDIEKLIENYNKAQTENASLQTEITTLKEEMALMQSQLDWLKKQMFGRKTEQSSVIFEGGEQLSLIFSICSGVLMMLWSGTMCPRLLK